MPRKFKQLFTDLYKQYNASMNPMLVLNIEVEDNNYDINVSPDKREVFIKNEDEVVAKLKIHLNEFFEDIQRTKAYDCQSVPSSAQSLLKGGSINQWVSKKRPFSEITKPLEDSFSDDNM